MYDIKKDVVGIDIWTMFSTNRGQIFQIDATAVYILIKRRMFCFVKNKAVTLEGMPLY